MELKVWVEGLQRIVCGVTEKTTCQDVVYALAHATGKTGRFTLIQRFRNLEQLLSPQEFPLKVLQKYGEFSSDVQFILQRSSLQSIRNNTNRVSPQVATDSTTNHRSSTDIPLWKNKMEVPVGASRLSPDSGRGTGSDTSNGYLDGCGRSVPIRPYHPSNTVGLPSSITHYRGSLGNPDQLVPPAYRPPPLPHHRNSSPLAASEFPPPYRAPPAVRQPHYSPPPTHRTSHLSRHPSKSSLNKKSVSEIGNESLDGMAMVSPCSLVELVSSQQSKMNFMCTSIQRAEAELAFYESQPNLKMTRGGGGGSSICSSIHSDELRQLEERIMRNDTEIRHHSEMSNYLSDYELRGEINQLKHRLEGTDQELQKTNFTLKRLDDEMKHISLEKNREREKDVLLQLELLQNEIKNLHKNTADGATISQNLTKEVKEVEVEIRLRKAEMEKLRREICQVNFDSLALSPSKDFTVINEQEQCSETRESSNEASLKKSDVSENDITDSPNVARAKNPHGVWV